MPRSFFALLRLIVTVSVASAAEPRPQLDPAALYQAVIDAQGRKPEPERAHDLFRTVWDIALDSYPEVATMFGRPGSDHLWTDNSAAALARRRALVPLAQRALASIDRRALNETDRVSCDLLQDQLDRQLESHAFPIDLLALTQRQGIHHNAVRVLGLMPRQTVAHFEHQLARLRALPAAVDQSIALLEAGLARGITPPRIVLRDVPEQILNQIPDDPLASPLLSGFKQLPASLPEEERVRLVAEAAKIYREAIVPAWRTFHGFVVRRYLPGATERIAAVDRPDGAAWYAYEVRTMTTLSLTPDAIHDLGLAEVARIRAEMEEARKAAGFTGTLAEFFTFLRTDPKFFFTDKEDLLRAYRDIAKRVDPELPRLVKTLPRLPYGVSAVPAFAEKSQTTAYYQPGSAQAGRAGIYFANTYALHTRPKWEMEALTLHEAVPGHHLQIALAQEIDGLPEFRRNSWGYTGFVEGWALYAESLGEEMGFYRDPYARFGQLTYEMWRAIRLVVDTGMHSKGWSRQRAIDYFLANAPKTENDVVVEIDRYISWPGQALGYKLGELKLKELRAFATRELGAKFDLRQFHEEVLRHGAIPLTLLETNIRSWVARTQAAP
jgi:uncharacterized protein (DUF885 family)